MEISKLDTREADKAFQWAEKEIERVKAEGLDKLDLDNPESHALTKLPPQIAELSNLLYLDLKNTQVSDITPISGLNGLQRLFLNHTNIKNISPLSTLSGLLDLGIGNTQIRDISSISGLTKLQRINFSNTPIDDIISISELHELQFLNLNNSLVSDLRPIGKITTLINDNKKTSGLHFQNTPAEKSASQLTRFAVMPEDKVRTQKTLTYLGEIPDSFLPSQFKQLPDHEDIEKLHTEIRSLFLEVDSKSDDINLAVQQIDEFHSALQSSRSRLKTFEEETKGRIDKASTDYKASMEAAEGAFSETLATSEPVKLWKEKQSEHETSRNSAFKLFQSGLGAIILAVIALLIFLSIFPETADALLAPAGCDPTKPETCKGLGFRGLIVTASTLTVLTVLLWFTRLQMKLYLAERHMAIDARERQAFAQTYLGFLKEGDTSEDAQRQRTMVYAALFRPSSDGTIKEDGGLDPAITAAISKLLTK